MTPSGGARPGAGRHPRGEPKSKPIWCGQMSEAERESIKQLTPDERKAALLRAIEEKQPADLERVAVRKNGRPSKTEGE